MLTDRPPYRWKTVRVFISSTFRKGTLKLAGASLHISIAMSPLARYPCLARVARLLPALQQAKSYYSSPATFSWTDLLQLLPDSISLEKATLRAAGLTTSQPYAHGAGSVLFPMHGSSTRYKPSPATPISPPRNPPASSFQKKPGTSRSFSQTAPSAASRCGLIHLWLIIETW